MVESNVVACGAPPRSSFCTGFGGNDSSSEPPRIPLLSIKEINIIRTRKKGKMVYVGATLLLSRMFTHPEERLKSHLHDYSYPTNNKQ